MKPKASFNSLISNNSGEKRENRDYVIVTADDYGYSPERDDGIIFAYTNGIVTRASLLVNGYSAFQTAVKLAEKHGLVLGIHLNLTEGRPLNTCYSTNENNSLLCDGKSVFRGKFGFRDALARGDIDLSHVRLEILAQIEMFIKYVGYLPNHVDGHQHIHVLPEICNILADVMNQYSLSQIRIPFESQLADWFHCNPVFYQQVFQDAKAAKEIYERYNISSPSSFIGVSLMGCNMNVERLILSYQHVKERNLQEPFVCEFMVHPGYSCVTDQGGCGEGPDEFARSKDREHELNILCNAEVKMSFTKSLITFAS